MAKSYLAIGNPNLLLYVSCRQTASAIRCLTVVLASFRTAKRGTGVDGARAASASTINCRLVEAAVKTNSRLPGDHKVGSMTDIRKKRGWEVKSTPFCSSFLLS